MPRDVASRAAKVVCDDGFGVGATRQAVYLDFADAIQRLGAPLVKERYGNLFEMYERITGEDPYRVPMRIYPAVHYTMGGLWVDYRLMSTIPGLFVLGEANFSDHGANRLGASALMQGLADGYFIISSTVGDYIASGGGSGRLDTSETAFDEAAHARKTASSACSMSMGPNGYGISPGTWTNHVGPRRHVPHPGRTPARHRRHRRPAGRNTGKTYPSPGEKTP